MSGKPRASASIDQAQVAGPDARSRPMPQSENRVAAQPQGGLLLLFRVAVGQLFQAQATARL